MLEKIKQFLFRRREIIVYLIFGVLTTFVNWCVYGLFVKIAGLPVAAGNVIAWTAAVIFAFFTNKIFVFQSRSWQPLKVLREAGTFLAARIISGIIELAGVPALYYLGLNFPLFNIEGFLAKVIVTVFVIILNFFLSKKFIFKR